MIHKLSISNETLPAFKDALESNKTDFEVLSNIEEGRTEFVLDLKFANELFYIGASYGINCLSQSIAHTESPTLSN